MGNQQLLLLALGVIIVGVAMVVGFNIFSQQSEAANRDAVVYELQVIGQEAIRYASKPAMLGGGEGVFSAFVIPEPLDSTATGDYVAANQTDKTVITGTSRTHKANGQPVEYTATVMANSISIAKDN